MNVEKKTGKLISVPLNFIIMKMKNATSLMFHKNKKKVNH